jgi:creatinine amidohydrolase
MDVVRGYCRSLDAHGFEHVVLVPTHGGNFGPVTTVAPEVAREVDASVIPLADLDAHTRLLNEGLAAAGVDYEQAVVHAGAAETAIVLAVAADLVRRDAMEPGPEGEVSVARLLGEGFDDVTERGVLGDPTVATADAGEAVLETVTDAYVARIEAERTRV